MQGITPDTSDDNRRNIFIQQGNLASLSPRMMAMDREDAIVSRSLMFTRSIIKRSSLYDEMQRTLKFKFQRGSHCFSVYWNFIFI